MNSTKFLKSLILLLIVCGVNLQAQNCDGPTDGWTGLCENQQLVGLEQNPLKGIASKVLDGQNWNGFPFSIQSKVYTLGEIYNDDGSINFSIIDNLLESQAQLGRVCMVQISIDDGKHINPLEINADGSYRGEEYDLPAFLAPVRRLYYQGNRQPQIVDPTQNVFPYDPNDGAGNPSMVVDYNDPLLIDAVEGLIEQLAQRYDNDPRLFIFQNGIYGIFGELALGSGKSYIDDVVDENGQPLGLSITDWEISDENHSAISNTFIDAFTITNLVARNGNIPNNSFYGFSDGLYFGASISATNNQFYFQNSLESSGVGENWRNQVIGGEMDPFLQQSIWTNDVLDASNPRPFENIVVTGDPGKTTQEPQNVADVFDQTHPTFIFQEYMINQFNIGNFGGLHDPNQVGNPQHPYAGQENTNFWNNALLATKRMGYTFYLNEFKLSTTDGQFGVEVNIQNTGVAPMYADWEVEFGYFETNGQGGTTFTPLGRTNNWNLSVILPDTDENKRLYTFDNSAGILDNNTEYTFGLRIVNPLSEEFTVEGNTYGPYTNAKFVRFANETQDQDQEGWLTLGTATLANLGEGTTIATTFEGNDYNSTMNLGETQELTVTVVPIDAPFSWLTNAVSIATVDQNGTVTAHAPGNVEISAITPDGQVVVFPITVSTFRTIPSRIEAEDFTFKEGPSNLQIVPMLEGTNDVGDVILGNLGPINGFEYQVNVDRSGGADFDLSFRVASPYGAPLRILVKGENETAFQVLDMINLPALPDDQFVLADPPQFFEDGVTPLPDFVAIYNIYQTSTFPISLPEGKHTIRLEGNNFNFNWFEFEFDSCLDFTETVGASCNDGNPTTLVDRYIDDCSCEGTPEGEFVLLTDGLVIEAEDFSDALNVVVNTAPENESSAAVITSFDAANGDWLEYAVEVQGTENKNFILDIRASSPFGGTFGIELINDSGTTGLPSTSLPMLPENEYVFTDPDAIPPVLDFEATFSIYKTTSSGIISLPPGKYILRVLPGEYNLNWIKFNEVVVNQFIQNGVYAIQSESNAFITTTVSGGVVNSQAAQGGDATSWEFMHLGDNVYTIESVQFPGELLGITSGVCNFGESAGLTANADPSLARFQWQATNVNGKLMFTTVGCSGFSLDISAGNPTVVNLFFFDNTQPNQLFAVVPVEEEVINYIGIPSLIEAETANLDNANASAGAILTGNDAGQTVLENIAIGDTFDYPVSVSVAGDFVLDFRVSGNFSIGSLDVLDESGNTLTSLAFDPITGDFNTYQTYTSNGFILPAGDQIITLQVTGSNFNLNWIEFRNPEDNANDCGLPWFGLDYEITDELATYTSEVVDISCAASVCVSIDLEGVGPMEHADYLNVYYQVNNGPLQPIFEGVNAFELETFELCGISGDNLNIVIEGKTSYQDESYFITNLMVVEENGEEEEEQEEEDCGLPWFGLDYQIADELATYTSETVDISCASSVCISVGLEGVGPMEHADYLNVYYQVDGGVLQVISTNVNAFDLQTVEVCGISGDNISIIIEGQTSYHDETYFITDLNIYAENGARFALPGGFNDQNSKTDVVDVFPNPTTNILNVRTAADNATISIFNAVGMKVLETKLNQIDVQHLSSGIYFLKCGNADIIRFVKE